MATLAIVVTGFLLLFFVVALFNLFAAPRLENYSTTEGPFPRISVLVPARNEERNLPELFQALGRVQYPNWEVIFLDDDSTDRTPALLYEFVKSKRAPARALSGTRLPMEWLGKNWACWQLSREANGDIFLFLDADVRPGPLSLRRAATALAREKADGLTVQPRHELGTPAEKALLPVILFSSLVMLLPLRFLPRWKSQWLAFANGQWIFIRRNAYEAAGGHRAVKGAVVEDMALVRRFHATKLHFVPFVAAEDVEVRMYHGAREVLAGFGKNLYVLAGNNPAATGFVLVILLAVGVLPLAAPFVPALWGALALWLAIRLVECRMFRMPLTRVLWHPFGVIGTAGVLLYSGWLSFRRRATWKGRTVATANS